MLRQNKTLFIVDDDEDDISLVKSAFLENNLTYDITSFGCGTDLIEHFDKEEYVPDLILMDLNMPKMNGFQTMEILRKSERLKHIPIIVFTTSGHSEEVMKSYRIGGNSFITKPSKYSELLILIQKLALYWFETVSLPPKK
jgi:CheY-like chemotaxis protein